MNEADAAPFGVMLSGDLMFTSRVTGTANQLGHTVRDVMDLDSLITAASDPACRCVIIDLGCPILDWEKLSDLLTKPDRPAWVAFGSHVRTDLLKAAREAGCDQVMPKSQFTTELVSLLNAALGE